jgi:hypothetical protein
MLLKRGAAQAHAVRSPAMLQDANKHEGRLPAGSSKSERRRLAPFSSEQISSCFDLLARFSHSESVIRALIEKRLAPAVRQDQF